FPDLIWLQPKKLVSNRQYIMGFLKLLLPTK
ncbi:MAG: hypothetical protein ACI9VN_003229, partial [Patescibacteria group bacterium]